MAEGNGDAVSNESELLERKDEPMEEDVPTSSDKPTTEDGVKEENEGPKEPVVHTDDYQKLIDYGLNEKVADKLDEIYVKGKLAHVDLDERALDALKEFQVDGALAVLKQFLDSNLEHVSNKSAYLCGVMKTYRQKSKLPSTSTPTTPTNVPVKGPDEDQIKLILERTGYTLDVTTGQRKYGGPPPGCDISSQPGSGCEIFVGKIPKDMYEDELIPLFEKCGKIWDLRLMMDPMTSQNRGYAFITYCDRIGAIEAVKQLDNYEIRKTKNLKVNVSVPNLRLFVGNIPKSKSKEEIYEEFYKLAAGLMEVIIYSSPNEHKKNRGFCFLEYESHKAASLAKRRLGTGRIKVWGCDIIVDWADPQEEPDQEIMNKVKVLYVRNLTSDVSEETLKETFEAFGKVDRVKKIKDYAFVHFEDRDNAIRAMEDVNGKEIGGTALEVSLAKPPSDKKKKEEQLRARERRMMGIMHQRQGMVMMPPPPPPRGRGGAAAGGGGGGAGSGGSGGGGGMRPPVGRDYDYDYDYYGYGDYRGGYADPYYDDFYRYDDYYDYGYGPGPRGRGRGGPDRARGRGGPALRGRAAGPPARGRGAMPSRGVRGARGGRGATVARGRGSLAGKRKFDGGHQNQGDSKRRYQNSSGQSWGNQPIPQQPLDSSDGYGNSYGANAGGDAQWYQDSYGPQWA